MSTPDLALHPEPHPDPAAEAVQGIRPYLDILADLHDIIAPRHYLEIGVRRGRSLALARCPSLGIDPCPDVAVPLPLAELHRCTSDDFFLHRAAHAIGPKRFDLAFIDGMHLSEFVLRDFLNVEPVMAPNGVIVVDDVLPNHPVQAHRTRHSRVWTGDVWRLGLLLQERRPDLRLTWLDASPAGLLLVTNLAPDNRRLRVDYEAVTAAWSASADAVPPPELLSRALAVAPDRQSLQALLGTRSRA